MTRAAEIRTKYMLLSLLSERQRRRKAYARRYFDFASETQKRACEAIFSEKHKEVWVFGGNRSGKTELGGYAVCRYAAENSGSLIWVVSVTFEEQIDTTQKKVLKYLHADEVERITYRFRDVIYKIYLRNNTVIQFKSYEQERKKFQGASVNFIWFDEEPPEDIYQECLMRTVDSAGQLLGTMTPIVGYQYLYEKTKQQSPNIAVFYLDTLENRFLPQEEIEKIVESFSEEELETRLKGRFIQRAGLVYKEFDRHIHVIEPFPVPADWYIVRGIDYGYTNPFACLWVAIDPDETIYVIDEHYKSETLLEEHSRIIKQKDLQYSNKGPIYIDPSTESRQGITGTSIRAELAKFGVPTIPANNDVLGGIQRIKQLLSAKAGDGKPRLRVFRSCENLIFEFENYTWPETKHTEDKNKPEKPEKRYDHALDALRYIVNANLRYVPRQLHKRVETRIAYSRAGY